jgi:hypothetical protein
MQNLQQRVANTIAEEVKCRRESANKMGQVIDEKAQQVRVEIERESDSKGQIVETL